MSYLEKMDEYFDSLKIGSSALVDSWFMMSGPVPIFSVVAFYLMFVRLGPQYMKNRPPLQMKKLITYYNAAQVAYSVVLCYKSLAMKNIFREGYFLAGCAYSHATQSPELFLCLITFQLLDLGWWYFFAKFTELLDTIFFILRKKNNQVSFLHVYHHSFMALYSWSYLKYGTSGQGAVLCLLNSGIHVVMYAYYLLAGLGPHMQKYLWWKKYVTTMQIGQFIIMLIYNTYTYLSPRCQYSTKYTCIISINIIIFLLLFSNFYNNSYHKKSISQNMPTTGSEKELEYCKNGKLTNGRSKDKADVNDGKTDRVENGKLLTRRSVKVSNGTDSNVEGLVK